MKLFFGEFKANYDKYLFPYQVWLMREEGDDLGKIYEAGFLPIRNLPNVYYLSRSLRVDLKKFTLSSENRRILRKTEDFKCRLVPLDQFSYSPSVQRFCKDYFDRRFGKGKITSGGIKDIFQKGVYSHVFVWEKAPSGEVAGYAVCFLVERILQYAHAFYDLSLRERNLGARMILEAVIWAKENDRDCVYLGTVYNQSAFLTKTEFAGVEFFNGFTWSNNLEELKYLLNKQSDSYLLRDQEFKEKFYPNIQNLLNKYGIRVKF